MKPLKLVIFDCDGVMFDSKEANKVFYNSLLEHFGHRPMDEDELEYVHMHHVMDSVRYIFRHYPDEIEKVHAFRNSLDYADFVKYMTMEPDLPEFLDFLIPKYKTAISTNRTTTMRKILKIFNLENYFGKVVTASDVANPKPHPEALENILSHFALGVDEAIYIGDSVVDKEHAANIGMRMIAFKNPSLPAEYHVNSFMEIASLPYFG
jgi:HAD superfamily hydrolase (TIGR01549 family)